MTGVNVMCQSFLPLPTLGRASVSGTVINLMKRWGLLCCAVSEGRHVLRTTGGPAGDARGFGQGAPFRLVVATGKPRRSL